MVLFLHFRTGSQALFRQPRVMQLTFVHNHVRDMVSAPDMIALKTEGADPSRRTHLLARGTNNSLGCAPNHPPPTVLRYKFSTFNSPASAIRKIAAASANTSWPAICTPSHFLSNSPARSLPRSNLSRSWKNSESLVASRELRVRTGTSPEDSGNMRSRTRCANWEFSISPLTLLVKAGQ